MRTTAAIIGTASCLLWASAATAVVIDMKSYGPCHDATETWTKSTRPEHQGGTDADGVRYSTNIGTFSGQVWCRWQFSATQDEYFDVMYWSQTGDDKLRYSQTYEGCTNGASCDSIVTYANTVVYTPRFYTLGTTVTGSGSTSALADFAVGDDCVGTNDYSYQVKTLVSAGEVFSQPEITPPVIWVQSKQSLEWTSGPCSDQDWEENWFVGLACDDDADGCKKTWFGSWGGPEPFSWSNTASWADRFEKFND